MHTSCKQRGSLAMVLAAGLCVSACQQAENTATTGTDTKTNTEKRVVAEKPFAGGGSIHMRLDGGDYEIRPAADDRVRVTVSGNAGDTKVEVTASGARADVVVKDTPHKNFHATIEVPKAADLNIRLSAGDLTMAAITGNKDVESYAGDIKIAVGDPNDYADVDASVKAGDIHAGVFGGSKSGLLQHFTWSGHGKYSLHASLGAGNLVLRDK
jgi:hypothetical protein